MNFQAFKLNTNDVSIVESLTTLIFRTVNPETWQRLGGPGSIGRFQLKNDQPVFLIVWQTDEIRTNVKTLLQSLGLV